MEETKLPRGRKVTKKLLQHQLPKGRKITNDKLYATESSVSLANGCDPLIASLFVLRDDKLFDGNLIINSITDLTNILSNYVF